MTVDASAAGGLAMIAASRSRWHEFLGLLQAREYFAGASSIRFRARQRRQTWQVSRSVALVFVIGTPLHVVALAVLHPADAAAIATSGAASAASAVAAWWALGGPLRRRPELALVALALAIGGASVLLAEMAPRLAQLAVAYLIFLPPLFTMVLPWSSWTEVRWLALYGLAAIAFFALLAPPGSLSAEARFDLVFAMWVDLIGSFTGHVLLFRQRVRAFLQLQAIRQLQRRERRFRAELQRLHRSLEVTARTDELTGTGNRFKLDEDLRAARSRLGRSTSPMGLLEIDIDRFKAVNDRDGHLAGDEALVKVARALLETVRSEDTVYRYGGDEFLVLLGQVRGDIRVAGERMRAAVEALHLPHPDGSPSGRLTVSIGALVIDPRDARQTADEWFGRVDAALYRAKADGRDRVAVAPPSRSPGASFGPGPATTGVAGPR